MESVKTKRILITGVSGLLGNNLAKSYRNKYEVLGLYNIHQVNMDGVVTRRADLADENKVEEVIDEFKPDIIIHCAALTNIDLCEKDHVLATKLNVKITQDIVKAIKGSKTKLIYISTDAFYDGIKGNYVETDEVNFMHFYGKTKYKGELEALKQEGSLIVRTNIFGWNIQKNKYSLAEWIIHELSNGQKIRGFTDVIFSSIYTVHLASLLNIALEKDLKGVYHFASSTSMSKYQFATQLAEIFELDSSLIEPISVDEFGFMARRAKNLSLDITKLKSDLRQDIPTIEDSIRAFYFDASKK